MFKYLELILKHWTTILSIIGLLAGLNIWQWDDRGEKTLQIESATHALRETSNLIYQIHNIEKPPVIRHNKVDSLIKRIERLERKH